MPFWNRVTTNTKKKNTKLWFAIVKKRSYRPVRTQFEKIKEYTDKNMLFLANITEAHMQRDIYVYVEWEIHISRQIYWCKVSKRMSERGCVKTFPLFRLPVGWIDYICFLYDWRRNQPLILYLKDIANKSTVLNHRSLNSIFDICTTRRKATRLTKTNVFHCISLSNLLYYIFCDELAFGYS